MRKTLNPTNVKHLWDRVKALVEPLASKSQLNTGLSDLQTQTQMQLAGLQTEMNTALSHLQEQLYTKADVEAGVCNLKLCASNGTVLGAAAGTYKKVGSLVYIQANFAGELSADVTKIIGFPFTVPATGGATNASGLHYLTGSGESPKTFSVPKNGHVACTAMHPNTLFIYGTYTP